MKWVGIGLGLLAAGLSTLAYGVLDMISTNDERVTNVVNFVQDTKEKIQG
jgi:hypothetical protein